MNPSNSYQRSHGVIYGLVLAILIILLQIPIAFSSPVTENRVSLHPDFFSLNSSEKNNALLENSANVYDSLNLKEKGLSKEAYDQATKGWSKLLLQGQLTEPSLMTIVDFSQSSTKKRMFVLDMENFRVVFNTFVAHGKNSGNEWAQSFSNTLSSYKSSLGFFVTGNTYMGGNGYSLKLNGLEKGINDRANERAIVLHGADYVSQNFINAKGFLGRSYGCPAVPEREATPIINAIKGGTCLFIYSPDQYYLSHSYLLNS